MISVLSVVSLVGLTRKVVINVPRPHRLIASVLPFLYLIFVPSVISAAESPGFRLRLHSGTSLAPPLSAPTDTTQVGSITSLAKPAGRGASPRHSTPDTRPSTPSVAFRLPWQGSFLPPSYNRWSRRIGCRASYDLTSRWRIGLSLERVYTPWSGGQHPFGYNPWSTRVTLYASYGGVHFGFGVAIVLHDSAKRSYRPRAPGLHPGFSKAARSRISSPPAPSVVHRPVSGETALGCTAPTVAALGNQRREAPVRIERTPDRVTRVYRGLQERYPRRAVRPRPARPQGKVRSRLDSYDARHRVRRASSKARKASPAQLKNTPPPRAAKTVASRYASSSGQPRKHAHFRKFQNRGKGKSSKTKRGR